jgi:DtxR family Mn-dependent transcriptional regulator
VVAAAKAAASATATDARQQERDRALTRQAEDYLKAVYEIERHGAAAGTNDVAAAVGIAAPSASGMLRRLARLGLVTVERYRGARLTPAGRRLALRLIRRHRIIESFLVTRLGFGWDDVHEEAERLEHAASDELVDRMDAALGHPVADPHGAPIPTSAGQVDERRLSSIADLPLRARARVVRMSDRDPAFLRYLDARSIRPGATVRVEKREPFDGPLTLSVGGERHTVGSAAATRVFVERRT